MMRRATALGILIQFALGAGACGQVDQDHSEPRQCGSPLRDADTVAPEITRPRPDVEFWHTDPALGGCLARVSDHAALPDEGSLQSALGRQAFSPDGTLVVTSSGAVLDAETFEPRTKLPNAPAIWAPNRDHVLYFTEDNGLYRHDVDQGASELVESFVEYAKLDPLAGLREPSLDGKTVALVGERAVDGVYEVFVWDFQNRTKSPSLAGPIDVVERVTPPNWASVSPSGHHVVVGWPEAGDSEFRGTELYDANMSFERHLSAGAGAADLAIDSQHQEWLVEWSPAEHGPALRKIALADPSAASTDLVRLDGFSNIRISCRAPGSDFCAISTHGNLNGHWLPLQDEIVLIDLDGRADAPRVERLAHHESAPEYVAAQPLQNCALSPDAVLPNPALARDGRSVLFTSNWNAHCFGELYLAVR